MFIPQYLYECRKSRGDLYKRNSKWYQIKEGKFNEKDNEIVQLTKIILKQTARHSTEAFFILFRLFLFPILWKLRLDQQNAHSESKWLFSCMCLKCFALEQSLHVSWHSTAYSAYFKHWELFKVNFKKHNGPRNEKWVHKNHPPKNSVTENRSDIKKELQPTGLKNNQGRGIYPTTVSLFIFKTRDVTSEVSDPL